MTKASLLDATKYTAGAVLTAWLGVTNLRVTKLEDQLYKCMEGKSITANDNFKNNNKESLKLLAILPKEIKIKKK